MNNNNFGEPSGGDFIDTHFDFTRCQRPDGSYYGTGGQCRKGGQVGDKEKEASSGGKSSGRVSDKDAKKLSASLTKQIGDAAKAGDQKKVDMLMKTKGDIDATIKARGGGSQTKEAAKKQEEKASKMRAVAKDMKPKVKELDARAKDLNKEADRLEKALVKQRKVAAKNPTKENKARVKAIQSETRRADRAAKQADKVADKAADQFERALRKAAK
jgi:hypothetical protein